MSDDDSALRLAIDSYYLASHMNSRSRERMQEIYVLRTKLAQLINMLRPVKGVGRDEENPA